MNKAYIAGLVDGEGYLGLLPIRNKEVKNPAFEPVVKIGMTGEESRIYLRELADYYNAHFETRKREKIGYRDCHYCIIKGKKRVLAFLNDIDEYLIVKKSQSNLLKEFCELPITHTRHKNFSQEVVERKEKLFNLLKELKQPLATTE